MIKLKCWRKKRNLTQLELAQQINTSEGYIHEIECGKKIPSVRMLYRIANVLNICVKDLLVCNCIKCTRKNKKIDV